MMMNQPKEAPRAVRPTENDDRRPFVAPKLRKEADLVDRTADRIFTFNQSES